MPKVKPERIVSIVATSYLVLIPATALVMWRKLQIIDDDLTTLWKQTGMPSETTEHSRNVKTNSLKRILGL